jgi:hypothetical protein
MKKAILKAAKTYLIITLVMAINICLMVAILHLFVPRGPVITSWEDIPGLEIPKGDPKVIQENLGRLSTLHMKGIHPDLRVVLKYCGKPDGYVGDLHSDLYLVYFYNRFGDKDAVAYVTLKEGFVVGVAHSGSSVNDHSTLKAWDIPDSKIPVYK